MFVLCKAHLSLIISHLGSECLRAADGPDRVIWEARYNLALKYWARLSGF